MSRLIIILCEVALIVAAGVWAAAHPGHVTIAWQDRLIDTSVAAVLLSVVILALLTRLVWRGLAWLLGGPGAWRRRSVERRRLESFRALRSGLLAAIAGDLSTLRKSAKKARALAENRSFSLLLDAQVAQLSGDAASAERSLLDMLDNSETAFLGLRGLTSLALQRGDLESALKHAESGAALHPAAPWVIKSLMEIYQRRRDWAKLSAVLGRLKPGDIADGVTLARKRALAALGASLDAERAEQFAEALAEAEKAVAAAPDFIPALTAKARLLILSNQPAKAAKLIEKAWKSSPHPDLADLYPQTAPDKAPLGQVKRFESLVRSAPSQAVSHLALGKAAFRAKLWGEARQHLLKAVELDPTSADPAYRTLAEIEGDERNDPVKAADWRAKADAAPEPPTWRCHGCSTAAASWSPVCAECGLTDSLFWAGAETNKPSRSVIDLPLGLT